MPHAIEPHEVLAYLNELGYKNITAQQLKEFIRDLKKLIKYDLRIRKQRENIENVRPKSSSSNDDDVFRALYELGTTSSKAKEVPKKEKVITVQIKKPTKRTFEDKSNSMPSTSDCTRVESSGVTVAESFDDDDEECIERARPKPSDEIDGVRSNKDVQLRPKASFIRPRTQLRPCKSDPVALYHAYQAEWKKQKFPGVENHANLRWAIRERMLGEPAQGFRPVASVEALSRKRGAPRRM